jgi:hypothetical protein
MTMCVCYAYYYNRCNVKGFDTLRDNLYGMCFMIKLL